MPCNAPCSVLTFPALIGRKGNCATLGFSVETGKNCLWVLGVLGILLFLMGALELDRYLQN